MVFRLGAWVLELRLCAYVRFWVAFAKEGAVTGRLALTWILGKVYSEKPKFNLDNQS